MINAIDGKKGGTLQDRQAIEKKKPSTVKPFFCSFSQTAILGCHLIKYKKDKRA